MDNLTITTLGLTNKDESVIKSLLRLFKSKLNKSCELVHRQTADIIIHTPTQAKHPLLKNLAKPSSLIVCYAESNPNDKLYLRKPIKAREFIALINNYAFPDEEAIELGEAITIDEKFFSVKNTVIQVIKNTLKSNQSTTIQYRNIATISIVASKKIFYSNNSIDAIIKLAKAPLETLKITNLFAVDLEEISKISHYPINNLLWIITRNLSQGVLINGHTFDNPISLSHWPNFSELANSEAFTPIALSILNDELSLNDLIQQNTMPKAELINYYNACVILGYAQQKEVHTVINKKVIFSIGSIGLSSDEVMALKKICIFSKARSLTYEFIEINDKQGANLLIVSNDRETLLELSIHMYKIQNSNTPVLYLTDNIPEKTDGEYYITRPLVIKKLLYGMDQYASKMQPDKARQPEQKTALVIDDSLPVRKQLEIELKALGIQVNFAETGEAAISMINDKNYTIIFLDVVMPGMDGYDVCKIIKRNKNRKHIPVIMLTSKSSAFDKVRGKLAGCNYYLTKPVDKKKFKEVVDLNMDNLT